MPLPAQRTTEDEALHREMERISLDWVMIYNPTDEDFYIDWLPWHHLVPNKNKDIGWGPGRLEVQRYLARWYCEHMTVYLINKEGQKKATSKFFTLKILITRLLNFYPLFRFFEKFWNQVKKQDSKNYHKDIAKNLKSAIR